MNEELLGMMFAILIILGNAFLMCLGFLKFNDFLVSLFLEKKKRDDG